MNPSEWFGPDTCDKLIWVLGSLLLLLSFFVAIVLWTIGSVCNYYKKDPTYPSLILSYLYSEECWYLSIVRYREKFAKGKEVVMSVKDTFLSKAIIRLSIGWLGCLWTSRPITDKIYRPSYTYSNFLIQSDFGVCNDAYDKMLEKYAKLDTYYTKQLSDAFKDKPDCMRVSK